MPTEREREMSRVRNRRYRAKMTERQKQAKRDREKARRESRKAERLALNDKLAEEGRRICSVCYCKKLLSEYSYNKRTLKKKLNKVCDTCLIKCYGTDSYSPEPWSPAYWRKKAYSCNCTAVSRTRRSGGCGNIQELKYKASGEDISEIYCKQFGVCFYCSTQLIREDVNIDHKTPLSRGGFHEKSNLVLCCGACNRGKFTMNSDEFLNFLVGYAERILKKVSEPVDKEPQG